MNWMRYRLLYLLISATVIGVGVYSYTRWGFNLSIDFTGGTVIEYERKNDGTRFVERKGPTKQEEAVREDATIVRFESVGPTFSAEIFRKTLIAVAIAAVGILIWIAWQFKSLQFGVSAILAALHDGLVLLGTFALFGHFFGAPVDTLFVTALLTTIAFSVHDTIVVFDRVRELKKKVGGSLYEIANFAVSQTMVRSLNNSLTIIFVLVALVLLGGETLRWFAVALLVGTITGTYSSPFVAVPLLVTWEEVKKKFKK